MVERNKLKYKILHNTNLYFSIRCRHHPDVIYQVRKRSVICFQSKFGKAVIGGNRLAAANKLPITNDAENI